MTAWTLSWEGIVAFSFSSVSLQLKPEVSFISEYIERDVLRYLHEEIDFGIKNIINTQVVHL